MSDSSSPPVLVVVDLVMFNRDCNQVYLIGSKELCLLPSAPWVGGEGYTNAAQRIATEDLGCELAWPAISEVTAVSDGAATTVIHFTVSAIYAGDAPSSGFSVPVDQLPDSIGRIGRRQVAQARRVQRLQEPLVIVDVQFDRDAPTPTPATVETGGVGQ